MRRRMQVRQMDTAGSGVLVPSAAEIVLEGGELSVEN